MTETRKTSGKNKRKEPMGAIPDSSPTAANSASFDESDNIFALGSGENARIKEEQSFVVNFTIVEDKSVEDKSDVERPSQETISPL